MDIQSYRELVRTLPLPSVEQCEAFTFWVSQAHSWYKHIPLFGKGAPFVFYLDPDAKQDRVRSWFGRNKARPRTKTGFHYTAIPTAEYLARFGYLAFASGESLRAGAVGLLSLRMETGFGSSIIDPDGAVQRLPGGLAGNAVRLTSIVHPYANQPFFWARFAQHDADSCPWPQVSGGTETFHDIQARCRELLKDYSNRKSPPLLRELEIGVDMIFADLVEPERARQRKLMLNAIGRMLRLAKSA